MPERLLFMAPDTAFILAAGLGTRLKPYTDTLPKPMVPILGKPLIGHILDRLIEAGVKRAIVNLHHKADVLRSYLDTRQDIDIHQSYEETLLDTGGAIKKVLPLLTEPFYMINGDAFWIDKTKSALLQLAETYIDKMDIALLLQRVETMKLTQGVGDYDLLDDNQAKRNKEKSGKYMFSGIRIATPHIFSGVREDIFSFLKLMDEAEKNGKLFGCVNQGDWHHISTPEDLHNVQAALDQNGS